MFQGKKKGGIIGTARSQTSSGLWLGRSMPVSERKEKRLRRQVRPGQGRPRCVLHKHLAFTQKAAAIQLAGELKGIKIFAVIIKAIGVCKFYK